MSAAQPGRLPRTAVLAVAAAVGLLAAAAIAAAPATVLFAQGGLLLAVLADLRSPWPRLVAAVAAMAAAGFAIAYAGGDPADAELARIAAVAAGLAGVARVADVLRGPRPRTGFWDGTVATALAAGALTIAMAYASARAVQPYGIVLAAALAMAAAWTLRPALSGEARASIGSWVSVGISTAALAGLAVGSVDLPRLGTDAPAIQVLAAILILFGGRAVHEIGIRRFPRAIALGLVPMLISVACITVAGLAPGWDVSQGHAVLAGRRVAVGPTWLVSPGLALLVLVVALTLVFTATAAGRRFAWTLGWMAGLAISIVGLLFMLAWLAGFEIMGSVAPRSPSATGAAAMLALGLGVMQVSSKELRLQRQGALWLPVLAASVLLVATVVAWQQAHRQQQALQSESTALALEQAGRAVRDAVASRVEGLSRVGSAVGPLSAAERATRLEIEEDFYRRDHRSTVALFVVGPDLVIREVFAGERATVSRPGDFAAWDEARKAAYRGGGFIQSGGDAGAGGTRTGSRHGLPADPAATARRRAPVSCRQPSLWLLAG